MRLSIDDLTQIPEDHVAALRMRLGNVGHALGAVQAIEDGGPLGVIASVTTNRRIASASSGVISPPALVDLDGGEWWDKIKAYAAANDLGEEPAA